MPCIPLLHAARAALVILSRCTVGGDAKPELLGHGAVQANFQNALYVQRVCAGPEHHTLSPIISQAVHGSFTTKYIQVCE